MEFGSSDMGVSEAITNDPSSFIGYAGFSDVDFLEQGLHGRLRWLSYHSQKRRFSVQVKGLASVSLVHIPVIET